MTSRHASDPPAPRGTSAYSWAASPTTRRVMLANRGRDTGPELAVRRLVHATGLRYRVNLPIPGMRRRTIDIAFTRARAAVFIDGCFWHGCGDHFVEPKTNPEYWRGKIAHNRLRDVETVDFLHSQGWTVLRFWEHEDPEDVARSIASQLGSQSPSDIAALP